MSHETASLIIQAAVVLVLIVAMTWIVLSPAATDEASKAALIVISSGMGYLFGKHS